jgi:hypothetical protein
MIAQVDEIDATRPAGIRCKGVEVPRIERAPGARGGLAIGPAAKGPAARGPAPKGEGPKGEGPKGVPPRPLGSERFGTLVRVRRASAKDDEDRGGAAQGAAAGGRPDAPFLVCPREESVRSVAARPEIARVLVGQERTAPEARIELRGGALSGASIHLVAGPGGRLEARLGVPTEAARVALAALLDRARHSLGSRGIVLREAASMNPGSKRQERERHERDRRGER